ncbi:cyclase family protein [Pseudonocardia halophobica]|uniref:Cyclase n=1 Tax=Pseudonocardia halophobica TaxID=29401 RepID=A0A9W6L890_9PSEU|nr:cyclase family protein [Pseudonocardia halophobica]GLL13999.1 hypothetical protein GCM10017577_51440 [Pseudonocardia halophobica]
MTPKFSELPVASNGLRSAWGVFGPEDDLGTVNFLTPKRVAAAATEIRTGERFGVTLPLDLPDPPFYDREPLQHTVFELPGNFLDDRLDGFYPQASSQWDALRHISDPRLGFYNGHSSERLGIGAHARGGIVVRAVLVDVARNGGFDDYSPTRTRVITVADLERILDAQVVSLREGDILLLHTGYVTAYLAADQDTRVAMQQEQTVPGLEASQETAEFLWDHRIAAVAADSPGIEVLPPQHDGPILHAQLIPMLGMTFGEFLDLGAFADAAAADRRYTAFFAAVPLNLPGGVGSPANAVVIR